MVYTDHSATVSIVRHISLSSSSVDKLNLRLIRASQYLSQFRLDIRYKPGKQHIVPDALSRPISDLAIEKGMPTFEEGTLDEVFAFNDFLIEMSDDSKTRLRDSYSADKNWLNILDLLRKDFTFII